MRGLLLILGAYALYKITREQKRPLHQTATVPVHRTARPAPRTPRTGGSRQGDAANA